MLSKRLLVLDVETTGIDPDRDSLVQIASCLLTRQELHEEAWFSSLVRPTTRVSPSARKVHGLSDETLREAPELAAVLEDFEAYAPADAILCGHNVAFDVAFLRKAYESVRKPFPFDYHTVDIWSVAFFILGAEGVALDSYSLSSLCGLYGIERGPQHDALEDVRASAKILRHLYASVRGKQLGATGQISLFTTQ